MDYKKVKEKALKENDPQKLLKIIEDNHLQDDEEIKKHFTSIDNEDTMEYSFYNRKKK